MVNNSRIFRIQNAKFSWYYYSMNTNIWRDFQICISISLIRTWKETFTNFTYFLTQ